MNAVHPLTCLDSDVVREVVHGEHAVRVRRERWRLDGGPPLAVERTVLPDGPTRPPVVLVHGLAQNRYTWRVSGRSFAGCLAEEGFDVYNLELRGHGLSRQYGAGNARGFEEYVDDVVRLVDVLPEPPFTVGHSLGGAAIVAASTVRSLRGVVHLAGTFGFASHNRTLRALSALSLVLEPALTLQPVRLSTGWMGRLIADLYSLTDLAGYGLPVAGWVPGSLERHLLEERVTRGFDWTSVEVWLQMSRWALGERFAWADAFSRVDVPLLVIAGDADPLVPPADARRCYEASGSTDRTFVEMDPWTHDVHWGHVDLVLGRLAPDHSWREMVTWLIDRA